MSEEQLKAFLEAVKADASLQEKLKAAAYVDAVAAIAKEAGFSISAEDLTNAQSELSEEELENVAGGTGTGPYDPGMPEEYEKALRAASPGICILTGAWGGTKGGWC